MTAPSLSSAGHDPHRTLLIAARIAAEVRAGQTILCCGLGQHDGVGAASLALARALAEMTAWRVLLVEAQGAEPAMPGMPTGPGYSDLVSGAGLQDSMLAAGGVPRLQLMGAGSRRELIPATAMLAAEMPGVLAALRGGADLVLLIGAPIRHAPATASLARHADATVLFTHQGQDRRDDLARAVEDCAAAGCRLLGTVILT